MSVSGRPPTESEPDVPAEPQPPTVSEVVKRAVEVCDPEGVSDALVSLLERYEDDDVPITAVPVLADQLDVAVNAIDDPETTPELDMARALILYLAHRRDELDGDPEELLRLAVRAEFDAKPPAQVADWLTSQGIAW